VRRHVTGEASLHDLVMGELGPDAAALVRPGVGVARRTSPGGAGPAALVAQLDAYRAMLESERAALGA
jgi:argininosuccinate lyase